MKFSPRKLYIHMLLKIPATRTPQGGLKFVALIIKILSCNKNFFFMLYDQNYNNCSTLISTLASQCIPGQSVIQYGGLVPSFYVIVYYISILG
jgi:hypothetical protein